jgi:hypothetical protein
MDCPCCKQSLTHGATTCDECAVRIAYAGGHPYPVMPSIRPGAIIAMHDFARMPLCGLATRDKRWDDGDMMTGTPNGIMVSICTGLRWFNQPFLNIRDACVRAAIDVYESDLRVRVVARRLPIGSAAVWYELGITPQDRNFRLARLFTSPEHTDSTSLSGPAAHASVAPLGATNVLELRLQGPTLQALCNDQELGTVHDAALGIGGIAIGIGTLASDKLPRRALFRWLEIREVMA